MCSEQRRYTIWLLGLEDEPEIERDLSWDEADHIMTKHANYGGTVSWALERAQCPEDCLVGCYDEDNWKLDHPGQDYPY